MNAPYGGVILEHFRRPRNRGAIDRPDVSAEGANPLCGDRVRVQLTIANDIVTEARFVADACAICIASASLLTSYVEGAPLSRAHALDADTIVRWLDAEIPTARLACATLPMEALHRGLQQWREGGPEARNSHARPPSA